MLVTTLRGSAAAAEKLLSSTFQPAMLTAEPP
jgi:hypothetical protein